MGGKKCRRKGRGRIGQAAHARPRGICAWLRRSAQRANDVADWRTKLPRTIQLAASFPASSERLFDLYLDPDSHAAITGAPVTISDRAGAEFRAFDGVLSGTILQVVPKRLIVQSWRT